MIVGIPWLFLLLTSFWHHINFVLLNTFIYSWYTFSYSFIMNNDCWNAIYLDMNTKHKRGVYVFGEYDSSWRMIYVTNPMNGRDMLQFCLQ